MHFKEITLMGIVLVVDFFDIDENILDSQARRLTETILSRAISV